MTKDPAEIRNNALKRVADHLNGDEIKRVVVLAGAGISTSSGIPDFRTPGSGLYDNLAQYNLPRPEAVFDMEYFHTNPVPFYQLAKEIYPSGRYHPNSVHLFIRLLHDKGLLHRIYTQNIDGLERIAGIPEEKIVECHGSFSTSTCTVCQVKPDQLIVETAIKEGTVAKCKDCGGIIKPDIVFFNEELPIKFKEHTTDMPQADIVFVMGTSLEVTPFAGVVDEAPRRVPRVLFNRDLVGPFRSSNRSQDIVVLGDLVDSVERLAELVHWKDDLQKLKYIHIPAKPGPRRSERLQKRPQMSNNSNRKLSTSSVPTPLLMDRLTQKLKSIQLANATALPFRPFSAVINRSSATLIAPGEDRTAKSRPLCNKYEHGRNNQSSVGSDWKVPKSATCINGYHPMDALTTYRKLFSTSSPFDSEHSDSSLGSLPTPPILVKQ